jgi:antitoxin (DNA-binding transcriptional repressor) of toxin-antitoxin stability system
MQTRIDVHDLSQRLGEIRALSGDNQIVLTDGDHPIARVVPLASRAAGLAHASRLSNPFLGEFTAEDFQEARQILALRRPGHTTDEIVAHLKAMEPK